MLTHGSLFAGIGGFDLGFERAGIKTIWQVEIDPYCQRVLAKHFPSAVRHGDIRTCGKHNLASVDILSGGFPCQDISQAGRKIGIDGERSALWSEYARIIGELRPRFAIVENVSALLERGMGRVLGDLADLGYDAEWEGIRASDLGAPHRRERVWIVAYPASERCREAREYCERHQEWPASSGQVRNLTSAGLQDRPSSALVESEAVTQLERSDWWATEPDVGRVAHGISARVDRLRGLGNAVVPQIAEWIGRRIVEAEFT